MSVAVFLAQLGSALAFVQTSGTMNGSMQAMGTGMMVVCILFGLLLFAALAVFVVLEFLWIKVWRQRLRNERRPVPIAGGKAA